MKPEEIWKNKLQIRGMYTNQQDAQDSCNWTLLFCIFQLNVLHVSDCISPSSGATL